jgi:glycosyltransferase involved in cell wall biosynthesis
MPNYEAMVWFLGEVYPHVQAQVPEVKLTITGAPAQRRLPPAKNVNQTGFVDDVRPLIARAWGSLVPIHSGGGTRLKILEAMALGTPVVATSKGAEGLDVQAGQHLLIGDTPESFAREVVRLLMEPELRWHLVNNAAQLIREKYDWAVVMPRFLDLVEQVATA